MSTCGGITLKEHKRVSIKLLLIMIVLVLVMTSSIGLFSYYFVKNALEQSQELTFLVWNLIGVIAVISIICMGALYLAISIKLKLLNEMMHTASELAAGCFNKATLKESKDEFGILAASINKISENIYSLVSELKDASYSISTSSHDLAVLTEGKRVSNEDVKSALHEISIGSASQASDIESTSHKVSDLQANIMLMTEESSVIMQLTKDSAHAVHSGKDSVNGLQASNRENANMLEQISLGITTLYQSVNQISGIVTTINNISKQTNLLALNASIEAARAGEHGKGFAVVADEVRKLAEETNQATSQIQTMIQNIEKETESTVIVMAQTTEITNGLNKSVQATENEFNRISSSINKIIDETTKLNSEIENVSAHSNVILDSIQNISAVAEQTAASTEEITASIEEQMNSIGTINVSSEKINKLSEKLASTLKKLEIK